MRRPDSGRQVLDHDTNGRRPARRKKRWSAIALAAGAVSFSFLHTASADDTWNGSTSSWTNAADWSAGVPTTTGENADLVNPGNTPFTVTYNYTGSVTLGNVTIDLTGAGSNVANLSMAADALSADTEFVGNLGRGAINQTGGTNTVSGVLEIGYNVGSTGSYTMSGGAILTSSVVGVGEEGNGTFIQNGGTNSTSIFNIGAVAGSTGSYTLASGASAYVTSIEYIGDAGTGTFNQTGGTNTDDGTLILGYLGGSIGSYTISGGTLNSTTVYIGGSSDGAGGTGSLNISGSAVVNLNSGLHGFTNSTLQLSGGILNMEGNGIASAANPITTVILPAGGQTATIENLGGAGINGAGLTMNGGGTLNLAGSNAFPADTVVDNGSTLQIAASASLSSSTEFIGYASAGTFIQSGGTNTDSGYLYLGNNVGSTGSYTLASGASLLVGNDEVVGNSGPGSFNQTGGSNTLGGDLEIGSNNTFTDSYTISGGNLSSSTESIGEFGRGSFNQIGGTNTVSSAIDIGGNIADTGSYTISGGTLIVPDIYFNNIGGPVSFAVSGTGVVNVSGSILGSGNNSTLQLSGGLLNIEGNGIASAAYPFGNVILPAGGQTATIEALGGAGINGAGLNMNGGGTLILEYYADYTGGTTIGAGSILQIGGGAITTGTLPAGGSVFDNGSLYFSQSNPSIIVDGTISGSGGVYLDGSGNTILTATNTYSGQTTVATGVLTVSGELYHGVGSAPVVNVSGGTLAGTGTTHSGITLNFGTIAPGAAGSTLNADGGLTMYDGTLQFDVGTSTASELALGGAASFSGGAVALTLSGAPTTGSVFTILTSAGLSGVGTLTLTPTTIGRTTLTPSASGNNLIVTTSGGPANLTWVGSNTDFSGGGIWDTNTTQNWNDPTYLVNPDIFYVGDNVSFDDSVSNFTVDINSGNVAPSSVTFANSSANSYVVNGSNSITGATNLNVTGTGTVTLNNPNYYTGTTTISGGGMLSLGNNDSSPTFNLTNGTLQLAVNYALGGNPTVNLGASSVLDLDGSTNTVSALTGTGIVTNTNATLATLTVAGGTTTFGGVIQDDGPVALTVSGGTLELSGANTYSGGTNINTGGTLVVGANNTLPTGTQLTLGNSDIGGTLDLNGHQQTVSTIQDNGGGALITNNGVPVSTLTVSATSIYGGTLADGTGKLAVSFTGGSSTLSGTSNAYTGGTKIAGGAALIASASGALPSGGTVVNNGFLHATNGSSNAIGKLSGTGSITVGDTSGSATNLTLAANSGLSSQSQVTVLPGAQLDVTNNGIVINYHSSLVESFVDSSILSYLSNASYNENPLSGTSIISSSLATNTKYAIGEVDGNDGVSGSTVAANTVEIAYTLQGDLNLDGIVNGTDFSILVTHFGQPLAGIGWEKGDINGDGIVNGSDFSALVTNFGAPNNSSAFSESSGGGLVTVPEPATTGLMVLGGLAVVSRRKRRGKN